MAFPSNKPGKVGAPLTGPAVPAAPPKKIAKGSGTIMSGKRHITKHAPNKMGHNPGYVAPKGA